MKCKIFHAIISQIKTEEATVKLDNFSLKFSKFTNI